MSFSVLGAAFLGFDGNVHHLFLFLKNQNMWPGIGHRIKSQEVLDEGIDLSRDR